MKLTVADPPSVIGPVFVSVPVGATLATFSWNVVNDEAPWLSVAVIVTSWFCAGPSAVPKDQLHVPEALVPPLVTVPTDAASDTVSPLSASDQVPVFEAVLPSLTLTVPVFDAIAGVWLADVKCA